MGHKFSTFQPDSSVEKFLAKINVTDFEAKFDYDYDDVPNENRFFKAPSDFYDEDDDDEFQFDVRFPAFSANAKIIVPPIPFGHRWAFSYIQGLWDYKSNIIYGNQGHVESIFPFQSKKHPTMLCDTNGPYFPFNGTDIIRCEYPTYQSVEIKIHMRDEPMTHIEWCSPADIDKNRRSFTEFIRKLKFTTWLVAMDLNTNNVFGLRCATWGTNAHIYSDNTGKIDTDPISFELYRIPPCVLFPVAANAFNFEVWRSYKNPEDDCLITSPIIRIAQRFK